MAVTEQAAAPLAPAGVPGEDRKPRRVVTVVGSTLLTLLLAGLLVLVAAVTVVPRVIGAVPLTVLSGSMRPTFDPGDLLVVRPTAVEAIGVGDVVTFQPISDNPMLVTHRVIEVHADQSGAVTGFVTQGDANSAIDDPIVPDQVMGRVVYSVPLIGHVTHAAIGPQIAVVAGVALLGYGLATVMLGGRAERRAARRAEGGTETGADTGTETSTETSTQPDAEPGDGPSAAPEEERP